MRKDILDEAVNTLKKRIGKVYDSNNLLRVSESYNGVWLEHTYDSLMYGYLFNDFSVAKSTVMSFINHQNEYGAYPYAIKDIGPCYYQIQECVSFLALAYELYQNLDNDLDFLNTLYESGKRNIEFFYKYRMTRNMGLVEAFVGYDTGHDNSPRLNSFKYKGNNLSNDSSKPSDRVIALDMNCIFYNNLITMSKIAKDLGKDYNYYLDKARILKENIFKYLYDKETNYFYDLDINNNFIKVKSSQIFHLFQEHVLDSNDLDMIGNLINNYLLNKSEFKSNYPIPSVSLSETKRNIVDNSWGYYTQGLTVLRLNRWYKEYHLEDYFKEIMDKFVYLVDKNYDLVKFPQEFDPTTGVATTHTSYYSSSMIIYVLYNKLFNN